MASEREIAVTVRAYDQFTATMEKFKASVGGASDHAVGKAGVMISHFERMGEELKNSLGVAGELVLGTVGKLGLVVAGLGAGLFELAHKSSELGVEFFRMSQRTGVSVEKLSALKYAAQMTEVPMEGLETGMKKLAKAMYKAQEGGNEQAKAFDQLGIKTSDASGHLRAVDAVLLNAADAISKLRSGTERAAYAQMLFGKSGTQLLPLLVEGSEGIRKLEEEARKLGRTFSEEDARHALEFTEALKHLMGAIGSIGIGIGKEMMVVFAPVIDFLQTQVVAFTGWFREEFHKTVLATGAIFRDLWSVLEPVLSLLKGPVGVLIEGLGMVAEGLRLIAVVTEPVIKRFGHLMDAVGDLTKAAYHFGEVIWKAMSFDWSGMEKAWADTKDFWNSAGEKSGKAFEGGLLKEMDAALANYYGHVRKVQKNMKSVLSGDIGDAPSSESAALDKFEEKINAVILATAKLGASKETLIQIESAEFARTGANIEQVERYTAALKIQADREDELAVAKAREAEVDAAKKNISQLDKNNPYTQEVAMAEAARTNELSKIHETYQKKIEALRAYNKQVIQNMVTAGASQDEINAKHTELSVGYSKAERDLKIQYAADAFGAAANFMQNLYVATGSHNKQMFEGMKAFATAEAVIKGAQTVVNAFEDGTKISWYVGVAYAVSAAAAVAAQIQKINSAQPNGATSSISAAGTANPSYSGGSPNAYPVPQTISNQPSQNVTVIINNPLSDQNWQKIVEDNIVPALNTTGQKNIPISINVVKN